MRALVVLVAALSATVLCLPAESQELLPVPEPSVTGFDEVVRSQLADARAALGNASAESHGDLGRLYLAYDLLPAAEACLENARRLEPEEALWPYLLGVLYQKDRQVDEALRSYEAALRFDGGDLAILIRLGELHLERSEPEKARPRFEQALTAARGGPGTAAARAGLGKALASSGDAEGAAGELEAALTAEPGASALRYPLALAYRELGRIDDARAQLARRGPVEASFPDPRVDEVGQLATGAGIHFLAGNRALGRGEVKAALAHYRKAIEVNPSSVPAHEALATTLASRGDVEGAIRHYSAALEVEPDNFLVLHNLGTVLARAGEPARAVEHLRRAAELVPGDPTVRYKLARNLMRSGRPEEAQREYLALIASEPEGGGQADQYDAARFDLSEIHFRGGRYREAVELLRELASTDPSRSWVRLSLGVALQAAGNEPGAMAEYRAVLEIDDAQPQELVQAHLGLARLLLRRQDRGGAKESFRAALELAPGHPGAHRGLAQILAQEGSFDEAAVYFGKVIERQAQDEDAHFGRSLALLLAEREGEARRGLEAGLRSLPGSARLALLLARVLAASRDDGVRDGKRALKLAMALHESESRPEYVETVAMALAELGRFDEAAEWQRRLTAAVEASGDTARLGPVRERLKRYENGEPCRAPWRSSESFDR